MTHPQSASGMHGGHKLGGGNPNATGAPQHGRHGAASQPHAAGKKLYIDPGELGQALVHLDNAIEELQTAYDNSRAMENVKNPGNEEPSHGFASVANEIGRRKRAEIHKDIQGLQALRAEIKAALHSYQETEHANSASLRNIQG